MPKYEVEYSYTTITFDVIEVEAADATEAREIARNEAELPWDWDAFEITDVIKVGD